MALLWREKKNISFLIGALEIKSGWQLSSCCRWILLIRVVLTNHSTLFVTHFRRQILCCDWSEYCVTKAALWLVRIPLYLGQFTAILHVVLCCDHLPHTRLIQPLGTVWSHVQMQTRSKPADQPQNTLLFREGNRQEFLAQCSRGRSRTSPPRKKLMQQRTKQDVKIGT